MDLDRLREIGESLSRHKLRTALTMLSVAWGTFVLVVLLGAGEGLQNNVRWQFRDDATNSLWIYPGQTSRPWEGQGIGRPTRLTERDHRVIAAADGIEHISSRFYPGREGTVSWRDRSAGFGLRAVHPDHQHIEGTEIVAGRFLDELDLIEQRKVAVLGAEVVKFLFRGADPLGQWVTIARVPFQVVGVFEDVGGEDEMRQIYLPITTARAAFGGGERADQIMFTVGDLPVAEAEQLEADVRQLVAARHHFDPADTQAIRVRNNLARYEKIGRIFGLLDAFVWLVGVGTVTAGLVGVSNIMLVSVSERTGEIGLRKALGATPGRIVSAIVTEAVVITAASGYAGIVGGVAVLAVLQTWLPENEYIRDPEIRLAPALVAAVLLTIFGAIAGFFPAWRAARIHPVEALRDA